MGVLTAHESWMIGVIRGDFNARRDLVTATGVAHLR